MNFDRTVNHLCAKTTAAFHQTKRRDYHNPADAYYNTQFSAFETRLDYVPANLLTHSTFWMQDTISN